MKNKEIKIGEGLGEIIFGNTREQVLKILGNPTEKDVYNASEDDDYQTEDWHYDEIEVSLSFDEEDNFRLTTIATSSPEFVLNNKNLIGLSINEVLKETEQLELGDNVLDDYSEENENTKLISYPNAGLNLWFEDEVLSEIQFAVLWKDEDTPAWP